MAVPEAERSGADPMAAQDQGRDTISNGEEVRSSSLPFEAGGHGRATIKIVDDGGIERLKIVELA